MKGALLLAPLVVLSVTSAAEGQVGLSPASRATPRAGTAAAGSPPAKNPFSKLFVTARQTPTTPLDLVALPGGVETAEPRPQGRIVCGTTVVPVDPKFDAAMPRMVPESGWKFAIRLVPPRLCGE